MIWRTLIGVKLPFKKQIQIANIVKSCGFEVSIFGTHLIIKSLDINWGYEPFCAKNHIQIVKVVKSHVFEVPIYS